MLFQLKIPVKTNNYIGLDYRHISLNPNTILTYLKSTPIYRIDAKRVFYHVITIIIEINISRSQNITRQCQNKGLYLI